jgi:O-antigen/teichoic acid export membrane protein
MISLVMILFGKGLLSFIFGAEFLGGYYSLVILIVAQLISVTSGSVALLLNMSGHEKKVLYVMAFSMTINVILNLIFIPKFGIEGAAFATLASTAVWNIYLSLYCFKKIDVNTSILSIFNIKL